jgi:Holliday junction resolvase RusA-like endonuclease
MDKSIRIVVDGFAQAQRAPQAVIIPPLPKEMRSRHHVQMYTPADVRKWQNDFRHEAREQMAGRNPLEGALRVRIDIALPLPKSMSRKNALLALAGHIRPVTRPDCDNYCKAVSDCLNGVAWLDDAQIAELMVTKSYRQKPAVVVRVETIGPENIDAEQHPLFREA